MTRIQISCQEKWAREVEVNLNLPRRVLALGDSEDKRVPMLSTCLFLFSGSHLSLYLPMDGPSHLFLPSPPWTFWMD